MVGYYEDKEQLGIRLRRIEGQVRGIQRMVENDSYCIDIMTQISAITGALNRVAVSLLEEHPNPTEADVREGLEGNLCRCTGYHNIVKAVLAAAGSGR